MHPVINNIATPDKLMFGVDLHHCSQVSTPTLTAWEDHVGYHGYDHYS